jgi:hypothetical protein
MRIPVSTLVDMMSRLPKMSDPRYTHGDRYQVPLLESKPVPTNDPMPELTERIKNLTFEKDGKLNEWVLVDVF